MISTNGVCKKEEMIFSEEYLCCQLCVQGKFDICDTEEPQTVNFFVRIFCKSTSKLNIISCFINLETFDILKTCIKVCVMNSGMISHFSVLPVSQHNVML